jgi:hypothetical protein
MKQLNILKNNKWILQHPHTASTVIAPITIKTQAKRKHFGWMNKLYLSFVLILSVNGSIFSQKAPVFNLTKDGVKPVVIALDATYSSNLIYTRVKEWVTLTYKYPKSVIRIDTENTLVKVGSIKEHAWKIKSSGIEYWNDLEYTMTIEIKEAKCRVTLATNDVRYKVWYNADGSLKKNFKESESTFEASINELLTSLYNQVKGTKQKIKDDW